MTLAIVDYGAGNLSSVRRSLAAVGAEVRIARTPIELGDAGGLVIPGVGHFAATSALDGRWRAAIQQRMEQRRPVLGICLGMQWLFEGSDEAPDCAGLGVFPGRCAAIRSAADTPDIKVPHVGWNTLEQSAVRSRLLAGAAAEPWAYFTHSYAAPLGPDTSAATTYGRTFAGCVERGLVFGTQWHPEKSGDVGRLALANFVAIVAGGQ